MAGAHTYSVWIVPDGKMRKRLSALIDDLGSRHGTKLFKPHLTLVKGIVLEEGDAVERMERFVDSFSDLAVKFDSPGTSNNYFKSVFIRVVKSRQLADLHRRASKAFGIKGRSYDPHVSLIYSNLPASKRREILEELGTKRIGEGFSAGSVQLRLTEGDVENWKCVFKTEM